MRDRLRVKCVPTLTRGAAALLALGLSGCAIVGVVASKVAGDPDLPAAYTPVKDNLLVLVENYRNPASATLTGEQLEDSIAKDLVFHAAAPVINPTRLVNLRQTKGGAFAKTDTAALGRALDAKQVLYVDLIDFTLDPAVGGDMIRGRAEARVRVIDAATGKTRWPTDISGGYPVRLETPFAALKEGATEGVFRERFIHTLSHRVARLLYNVSPDAERESDS